jgi:hypothetical protein
MGPLITDYQSLRAAIAARRRDLKLSQIDLDDLAFLASGHVGKLECGTKRFGDVSLAAVLGALGAGQVLVPAKSAPGESPSETWAEAEKKQKAFRKKRAQKAQRAWLAKTTPAQRRLWARWRGRRDMLKATHAANVRGAQQQHL